MITVTGYFTNTNPALSHQAVAGMVGQEPTLTLDHGQQVARRPAVVTEATTSGDYVHVTLELPGTAHPSIVRALKAEGYRGAVGLRSMQRDGDRVTSVDVWTAGGTRPWADRVMRGRHRGAYATAVVDAEALADPEQRRAVTEHTVTEARRRWERSFEGEKHGRLQTKVEKVPSSPPRFEVNVVLLPEGASL